MTAADPPAGRDGLRDREWQFGDVIESRSGGPPMRWMFVGGERWVNHFGSYAERPRDSWVWDDPTLTLVLAAHATPDGPTPFCPRCGQALGQSHTQGECDAGFARAITPDGPTPATAGLAAAERNEVCTCTPRSVGLIGRLAHSHECTLHRQAVERILAARIARGERAGREAGWDEGAYAGRAHQLRVYEYAHWSHIGRSEPDPLVNPYRADRIARGES